ncbi:hypothetical protein MMC17_001989 [Xylographa soralifera]|nr:hypothetical protein [Xylographa soralifera]
MTEKSLPVDDQSSGISPQSTPRTVDFTADEDAEYPDHRIENNPASGPGGTGPLNHVASRPSALHLRFWWKYTDDTIVPKVDKFPTGYPKLAAWIDSDPNYAEYRQYKYLRNRCLLYLQDKLAVLERRLSRLDEDDALEDSLVLKSRERDDEQSLPRRADLLAEVKNTIHEYDELLFKTKEIMHWKKPTTRNRRSYANFINNEGLFAGMEGDFIRYSEDLVALGGELEDSWLNGIVEDTLDTVSQRVAQFFFRSKAQKKRTEDEFLVYYDKSRLDFFIRLVMTIFSALLLMIPVFVLYVIQQSTGFAKDVVVLVFTLVFAIFLALFTKAKRHELFAATAG